MVDQYFIYNDKKVIFHVFFKTLSSQDWIQKDGFGAMCVGGGGSLPSLSHLVFPSVLERKNVYSALSVLKRGVL